MRICARVKPNSKKDLVEKTGETDFTVRCKAPAKEGKANSAVIKLMSEYLGIPKSRISIIRGFKNKEKILDIP